MSGLGTIFIERSDVRRSTEEVERMAAALGRGENIVVFPEGTFRREVGLKPFHSGAFIAAAKAGVPIAVGGLRGTRAALRSGTWLPRRSVIEFKVGQAFAPAGADWSATVRASAAARAAMAALCGEFASPE